MRIISFCNEKVKFFSNDGSLTSPVSLDLSPEWGLYWENQLDIMNKQFIYICISHI